MRTAFRDPDAFKVERWKSMLTRILVPLDGSARAEQALAPAASLARATSGTLIALRVYAAMPSDVSPELVAQGETADEREARAYLTKILERPEVQGIAIEPLTLGGTVARNILDAVAVAHADLVVMSSHGRSGITRLLLGSVAEHVVRDTLVPILVLRGAASVSVALVPDTRSSPNVWRACIGLDGSKSAEEAVAPTAQLLRTLAGPNVAEIDLVRILPPPAPDVDERSQGAQAGTAESRYAQHLTAAHDEVRAVAERLRTGDLAGFALHARWSVVEASAIVESLIAAAEHPERFQWRQAEEGEAASAPRFERAGACFLALATHGRGGLQRWRLGSIADRILEDTTLPLLLVHPSPTPPPPTTGATNEITASGERPASA